MKYVSAQRNIRNYTVVSNGTQRETKVYAMIPAWAEPEKVSDIQWWLSPSGELSTKRNSVGWTRLQVEVNARWIRGGSSKNGRFVKLDIAWKTEYKMAIVEWRVYKDGVGRAQLRRKPRWEMRMPLPVELQDMLIDAEIASIPLEAIEYMRKRAHLTEWTPSKAARIVDALREPVSPGEEIGDVALWQAGGAGV